MTNPFKIEQEHIENLLNKNKPTDVFDYIIELLKGEKKDDIKLKLFQ